MFSTLLIILMMSVDISHTHHIIFEQVGEMASAVTYIHVKFEVSFTDFLDHYNAYVFKLTDMKQKFKIDDKFFKLQKENGIISSHTKKIITQQLNNIQALCDDKISKAKAILHSFEGIKNAMPLPESNEGRIHKITKRDNSKQQAKEVGAKSVLSGLSSSLAGRAVKHASTIIRPSRGLITLGLGALGTFMGLYNNYQIRSLEKELEQTQDAHNRLVEVVQIQADQITHINHTIESLVKAIDFTLHFDMATMAYKLSDMEDALRFRLNQIIHTVQKAQDHRLAMDFLPANELKVLFTKVQGQANQIGHKLLTTQPSDLFQLELTYFYDGHNMQMLLHVPSVPKDSLLRLFKLHPFPLPINKNYSIIPMVPNELLAVSSGFQRLSAHLSSVDLLGCHAVNNIYLCERHGVLHKQLNTSCLGALYLQHFDIAQEICPLFIQPAKEIARQLLDNWFLIFSPSPQTAYIACRNGTQSETYLKSGITRIHLSPGCQMNLNAHILNADFATNLPTDIIHFQWEWDTHTLLDDTESIRELYDSGNDIPTLQDLNELKITKPERKWTALKIFISFIGTIIALALITAIAGLIIFHPKLLNASIVQLLNFRRPLIEPLNSPTTAQIELQNLYPTCPANMAAMN